MVPLPRFYGCYLSHTRGGGRRRHRLTVAAPTKDTKRGFVEVTWFDGKEMKTAQVDPATLHKPDPPGRVRFVP